MRPLDTLIYTKQIHSPVNVRQDMVGRMHFKPLPSSASSAVRFRKFQKMLFDGTFAFDDHDVQIAAHLIAFDAVAVKIDLIEALANIGRIYTYHEKACLDWNGFDGRVNRRFLSIFTRKICALPGPYENSITEIIEKLESALVSLYPSSETRLDKLLNDAQAWLMEVLPGPLYAHCTSIVPLAAVPRSTYAREESRNALLIADTNNKHREVGLGLASILDGYFSPKGNDEGTWLIRQLVIACRQKDSIADHLDKARMLKECLVLFEKSHETGKISSLILAWAVDLVESGTVRKGNLSPATINKYVGAIATSLLQVFKNKEIEQIDPYEFTVIYEDIIDAVNPGAKQAAASALSSWHQFLEYWLNAPPLVKSLYEDIAPSPPRANYIWPHEIELIQTWIESATCDTRLIEQIRVSLAIATSVRIRASELFRLRIHNIRIWPNGVEIEIAPMRRDGKLKTHSSRRVMYIEDVKVASTISGWIKHRRNEGALLEDFIFGDPHKPSSGYKIGNLYVHLNLLLKCATGDSTVSIHTLSHTHISERFEEGLLSNTKLEINPLDIHGADAGHASSQTGLVTYFHQFERLLRHFLDKGIKSSLKLNGTIVAMHTTTSAPAFRKRCSRDKKSRGGREIAWELINESNPCLYIPSSTSPYQFVSAAPPSSLSRIRTVVYAEILNVLCDLAQGMSSFVASSRNNMSLDDIHQIALLACTLLEQLGLLEKSNHVRDSNSAISEFQLTVSGSIGNSIQFERTTQHKFSPLLQYLSQSLDKTICEDGLNSWANCFQHGYINLDKPSHATGLIHLIFSANIPIGQIFVCTCLDPISNEIHAKKLYAQIRSVFSAKYPVPPSFDIKSPRRGRPSAYLVISSVNSHDGDSLQSAAVSMTGFNALLFAAHIYICFQTEQRTNGGNGVENHV